MKTAKELDEREKTVSVRERAAESGLPAWLIEMLDRLPKRLRKKTEKDTLDGIFRIVASLSDARKELRNVLVRMTTMKLEELRSVILKVAKMLGVDKPKEKKAPEKQME